MATHVRGGELQRRKKVRLRMRPNLVLTAQQEGGRTCYVLKDPVALSYFRLDEGQRFAVGLMDGTRTLEEIQQAYEAKYRPERLSLEELEAFAAQLLDSGLVQSESPTAAGLLFERSQKHQREALRSRLLNFLYIKVPLCDPDPVLGWLAARLQFLFSAWTLLLGLGVVLAAGGLVVTRWGDFLTRLPTYRDFFTLHTLLYLWAALGLAKLLHELGHGLCCKAYGGTVHEMGALFLFFSPTLYCNVSDSWTLPSKWQRMAVAAAGICVDLLVAAAATFVWWLSDPASLAHNLCFGLMVVCGVSTLAWNANPLMRFDGYYILSDWLEVPNLSERSARFLQSVSLRWLGMDVAVEPVPGSGSGIIFILYAAASYLYRTVMTAGALYSLYAVLEPHKLGVLGLLLGVAGLLVLLGRPVHAIARAIHARGRWPEMRPVRVWLSAGLLVLLAGGFVAVPLPMRVEGEAILLVAPDQVRRLGAPETGGFVSEVQVRDGQAVRAGDVLAVLTNPKLEIKLRVNEADQARRSQQRSGQVARLSDPGALLDPLEGNVQQTESELNALVREHALLAEEHARLTLRAPCDGVVMGLHPAELQGKWLEKGTEVCRVGDPQALRAVLVIDPSDHRLIGAAGPAWVRVHGCGYHSWPALVTDVAPVDAQSIPPQLSGHAGGEVATEQDPLSKAEKPRNQSYLVTVRLQAADPMIQPGLLGRVKIEAAPQTGWWRLQRYLARTFGWGL